MKNVVVRNIDRTDADLCAALAKAGVSTAHEAYGRIGLMKTYMRPIWPGASIAGPAVTVLAQPGDNWMIHGPALFRDRRTPRCERVRHRGPRASAARKARRAPALAR